MTSPIFTGRYKTLGEEVETMAHDLRLSVSDVLRLGAERLLREWERTGSLTIGSGQTRSSGFSEATEERPRPHPMFGDTKPLKPRRKAA